MKNLNGQGSRANPDPPAVLTKILTVGDVTPLVDPWPRLFVVYYELDEALFVSEQDAKQTRHAWVVNVEVNNNSPGKVNAALLRGKKKRFR